jgi:hypothetical protein
MKRALPPHLSGRVSAMLDVAGKLSPMVVASFEKTLH